MRTICHAGNKTAALFSVTVLDLQVIYNELIQYTDVGAAVGDPVATFEGAAVLAPRGRFDIELYLSFLKLTGQVSFEASCLILLCASYVQSPKPQYIHILLDLYWSKIQFVYSWLACCTTTRQVPVRKFLWVRPLSKSRSFASFCRHTSGWIAPHAKMLKWCATVQAQDYRIQYDSIVRIFVLPKSHTPHTLVVISLDPPIRKGQTFYQHILVQLPTDETLSVELEITDEQLAEKNEKVDCKKPNSTDKTWSLFAPASWFAL